ncbi:MAG: glycosyltransferase family 39 protein [Myxococcota bacterium]|nr:glycosyltransferase family 39 protein [Myxococcota bacterium]
MDAQPDEPQAVRGIRPRPGLALALIFVATVLFQLPFFDLWFSLMDEGHVLQFADLRLRGGEFYRDATFYPLPGAFHFLALVFDVFGASILVSRWVVILEFAAFSTLLFFLFRKVTSVSWAFAALGSFWLYRIWCFPHWQIYSYSTLALLVLLASATALVVYFERSDRRTLALSGLLFGLGVLCKQDYGAAALLALLASLALNESSRPSDRRPSSFSTLAIFIIPAAGVGAATGLYYWSIGVLGDVLQFTVFNHFKGIGAYPYSDFPGLWPIFGQDLALRTQLAITETMPGIMLTADWAALRIHPLYTDTPLYDIMLKLFFYSPQALLAGFSFRLWVQRRRLAAPPGDPGRLRYLVEFLFFALGTSLLLLAWLNKPQDYIHLAVLYWPFLGLVIFALEGWVGGRRARACAVVAVALIPVSLAVVYSGHLVMRLRDSHSVRIDHPRAGIYGKPGEVAMLENVLEYVEANTEPDDSLGGIPYFPIANFLSERRGPHRSAYIVWPFPEIPNRDAVVAQAMEETGTDVVLYNFTQFQTFDPFWEHAPVLFAYLVENFEIDRIFSYDTWGYKPAALRRRSPEEQRPGRPVAPSGLDAAPLRIDETFGPSRVVPPESRGLYVREMLWPFRPAIALRPSSGNRSTVLALPLKVPREGGRLVTAVAVHPQRWFKLPVSWVDFRLSVRTPEGLETLYERRLNTTNRIEDRRWFDLDLDLGAWAGREITLELSNRADNPNGEDLLMGGWAEPRLVAPEFPEAPGSELP